MPNRWVRENSRFASVVNIIKRPDERLSWVPYVDLKRKTDFKKIPKGLGCYWIWTNENVTHSFHKHSFPAKTIITIKSKRIEGEIIYNGVADNLLSSKYIFKWSSIKN
jgi:hypothetical protein